MKNPYVLACLLLVAPAVLCLTLQEDDLVFDDVGEEGTSTAATVISRRYDEHKANWLEQKYPHEVKRHQFDKVNNVPHVVVPVGHVLKLRVHKEAFTGPEDYYEVSVIIESLDDTFHIYLPLPIEGLVLFRGIGDSLSRSLEGGFAVKNVVETWWPILTLLNGDMKQ